MGLHMGLVMVRTDLRARMREVFGAFDYRPVTAYTVHTWNAVEEELRYPRKDKPREHVHKAVAYLNHWTVILDPELVLATDSQETCARIAAEAQAPLFDMICSSASASVAFSYYDPDLRRSYWISEGELLEDQGDPLPQERDASGESAGEAMILAMMEHLGVSLEALTSLDSYCIWELDESSASAGVVSAPKPGSPPARAWWKFW